MIRMSRRTALRGLVGGSSVLVGIPLLESMGVGKGEAFAQSVNPKIFGVFFWGGGIPWTPTNDKEATAADKDIYTPDGGLGVTPLKLSELLAPLEEVSAWLNVVTGISTDNFSFAQKDSHYGGQTIAMTADKTAYVDRSDLLYSYNRASIDRVIARNPDFYTEKPYFDSIQISAIDRFFKSHSGWNSISMDGQDQPVKPILDPNTLYRRIFGGIAGAAEPSDKSGEHYASVLDAVIEDARSLRRELGAGDQQRLDRHLEGLFEIETRLKAEPVVCEIPDEPAEAGTSGRVVRPVMPVFELQAEILVAALRCGVTRVFSHMLTGGAHSVNLNEEGLQNMGGNANHGALHAGVRRAAVGNALFSFRALNYLLRRLKEEESATGESLLDNSMIFATSEYATGWHHKHEEFPVILAGGAGGAISTGNHIRTNKGNMSDIHLTMLQALGLSYENWGWSGGETTKTLPILR